MQIMFYTPTAYVELMLNLLRETVPDFTYYGFIGPTGGTTATLYFFGVRHTGESVGGYALTSTSGSRNMLEDGVALTKFFLEATDTHREMYHPPEIREMWESKYLREMMLHTPTLK
jgi:hypothetical protein